MTIREELSELLAGNWSPSGKREYIDQILAILRSEVGKKKKNEDIYDDDELGLENIHYNQALDDILEMLK